METNPLTYHELFYANTVFCGVVAMILGMMIGSFLNVVIWRLPRGESLSSPPSHCPKCGHRIRWYENIPLLSWLCLRARCSSCHQPISWRYPAGETAVGVLFLLVYLRIAHGGLPVGHCFACLWLAPLLLAGGMIDLDHRGLCFLILIHRGSSCMLRICFRISFHSTGQLFRLLSQKASP